MGRQYRIQPLWFAFLAHRISGLCLALFLPAHFYVLGLAIEDAAQLDSFLSWTDYPLIKVAEMGLVFLLSIHMFGGLRLLALEFLPWSPWQKTYAAIVVSVSFFVATGFLMSAV